MGKKTLFEWLPRPGRIAVTFVLVLFSWVLFRSPTLGHAVSYLGAMFGLVPAAKPAGLIAAEIYTPYNLCVLLVCAVASFQPLEVYDWVKGIGWKESLVLAPLLLAVIAVMFTQTFNPFLYFQF